jgi:hypothetical protein
MATKPSQPAAAPAAPAQAQDLPLPASGGCWVRNPDGTLSRDLSEHPDEAPGATQPKE